MHCLLNRMPKRRNKIFIKKSEQALFSFTTTWLNLPEMIPRTEDAQLQKVMVQRRHHTRACNGKSRNKRAFLQKRRIDLACVTDDFSFCKEKSERSKVRSDMVPVIGVEPIRCCHHWILSPARLPIPSHRHKLLQKR